jgi:hypothetical protein
LTIERRGVKRNGSATGRVCENRHCRIYRQDCPAPFAGAILFDGDGGLMVKVDGAMFGGGAGFVAAGAATAFDGWVAVNVLKKGFAAVGDAATNDAKGAAFADGGSRFPVRRDGFESDPSKLGGEEFAGCRCQ